jgi:hypothetical protein
MTTLTKSLWIIGIVNTVAGLVFVTGLVDVSQASGLYVTFPLGSSSPRQAPLDRK